MNFDMQGIHAKMVQNKALVLMVLLLIAGVALRAAFIGNSDMTNDETFHIRLAYKFSAVIAAYPFHTIFLLAIATAFIYLIAYRRNIYATGIACAGILFARFVIGVPVMSKFMDVGYFYQIVISLLIAATGIAPHIVGELLMSSMLIALAIAGYFIGNELWNKNAGILLFAFLIISPLSMFMSGTANSSALSDPLMYLSLGLLLIAFKKPRLAPAAGILGALAIATRHPPALLIILAPVAMYLNKGVVLARENRKEFAIFLLLVAASVLIFVPDMLFTFTEYQSQNSSGPMFGYGAFPEFVLHYSIEVANIFAGTPSIMTHFLYINALSYFHSPLMLLLLIPLIIWVVKRKDKNLYVFLLAFALFFVFFTSKVIQKPHHMLTFEFSLLAMLAVFLSEIKFRKMAMLIAAAILAYFLLQSTHIVTYHKFNGISEFSSSLPDNSTIFTNDYGVAYYSGAYLADRTVRNEFLSRLLPKSGAEEKPRVNVHLSDYATLSDLNLGEVDFVMLEDSYLKNIGRAGLDGFEFCRNIVYDNFAIAEVYSRGMCNELN